MVVAKFIGRGVTLVAGVVLALIGIVLIIVGAASSPTSTPLIVVGVVLIVVGALFFLDGLSDQAASRSSSSS